MVHEPFSSVRVLHTSVFQASQSRRYRPSYSSPQLEVGLCVGHWAACQVPFTLKLTSPSARVPKRQTEDPAPTSVVVVIGDVTQRRRQSPSVDTRQTTICRRRRCLWPTDPRPAGMPRSALFVCKTSAALSVFARVLPVESSGACDQGGRRHGAIRSEE